MSLLISYIQDFKNRAGNFVVLATIVSRLLSFLASWIALQLLDFKELGVMLFAYSIVQFIIPIGGFGLHQSLVRYGALVKTDEEKKELFSYVLQKGFLASLTLIFLIISVSSFINFTFSETYLYLNILSVTILTNYVFEIVKIYFRLKIENKKLAFLEGFHSLILVLLVFLLASRFGTIGYISAIIITPLLASFLYFKEIFPLMFKKAKLHLSSKAFWNYGFFAGMSNVVTQLLFIVDFLLIGILLSNANLVTDYRYVSIIPFSLLFLPRAIITTDFVSFTAKISDRKYIKTYIKNYTLLFLLISIIILLFGYLLSDILLNFFTPDFSKYNDSFLILLFGICGIYITRGLFGNLLSSIGKATVNFYIVSVALVLNIIGNYWLLPVYGIKGAAITTASIMWITGIASVIIFYFYYNKLSFQKTD